MKLDDVQPGDYLAVTGYHGPPRKLTVDRVTKTQVIATNGTRWLKRGGHEVGSRGAGGWLRTTVQPWTEKHDEQAAAAAHKDACRAAHEALHTASLAAMSSGRLEALRRALAALEPAP
jgi:hypothetical protein